MSLRLALKFHEVRLLAALPNATNDKADKVHNHCCSFAARTAALPA